ncbi:stressosome-associated protein Prli42 [Priestia filamentosa]
MNKNWKKIIVYVMLFGMIASTILTAFVSFMY